MVLVVLVSDFRRSPLSRPPQQSLTCPLDHMSSFGPIALSRRAGRCPGSPTGVTWSPRTERQAVVIRPTRSTWRWKEPSLWVMGEVWGGGPRASWADHGARTEPLALPGGTWLEFEATLKAMGVGNPGQDRGRGRRCTSQFKRSGPHPATPCHTLPHPGSPVPRLRCPRGRQAGLRKPGQQSGPGPRPPGPGTCWAS